MTIMGDEELVLKGPDVEDAFGRGVPPVSVAERVGVAIVGT